MPTSIWNGRFPERTLAYKVKDYHVNVLLICEPKTLVKMASEKMDDGYLVVAAIDFGTAYSGYAFSTRADFKKDPLKVK